MNKLAYYQSYMLKEARKGRPRFDAMLASGDLPDDFNPHLGCPRVDQFESAMQKAWVKGVANQKDRMANEI